MATGGPRTGDRRPVSTALRGSIFSSSFPLCFFRFPILLGCSSVLGALILVSWPAWAQTEEPPLPAVADATITLTARSAGVGVGFVWGAGTVEYHGQRYPVRADGVGIGAAGMSSVTARGTVYHLQQIDDLNGEFAALGGGFAFGRGGNRLRMRNAKGVVIQFIAKGTGIQLGMGPRGITLQVGAAGGPPASAAFALPKTLGFGEAAFGPLTLRPTLNVEVAGFAEGNAGFGGQWAAGPINKSDLSMEHSNEVGLNARLDLGNYGTLRGRVSGIFSLAGGGVDPGATSFPDFNTNSYAIEEAFLSWQSGNAFPGLGYNAVQMGYGDQNYQVFDGLLFWSGAGNCGVRGACWLSPREAFREAGTLRLTLGNWLIEGYHLKFNDDPSTGTRLGGGHVEYEFHDWVVKDSTASTSIRTQRPSRRCQTSNIRRASSPKRTPQPPATLKPTAGTLLPPTPSRRRRGHRSSPTASPRSAAAARVTLTRSSPVSPTGGIGHRGSCSANGCYPTPTCSHTWCD
jgi:hypothetical protein